jgi:hypothetical protein
VHAGVAAPALEACYDPLAQSIAIPTHQRPCRPHLHPGPAGVISTEVGYSQGAVDNPSYEDVCSGTTGHAEVVRVAYDPEQVGHQDGTRIADMECAEMLAG